MVMTMVATTCTTRASWPSIPEPKRKMFQCAWVMQPERRCHLPVHSIMNASTSTAPPRNSTNRPRGPSMYRNDTISMVPVMSRKDAVPDTPRSHQGILRPPRK